MPLPQAGHDVTLPVQWAANNIIMPVIQPTRPGVVGAVTWNVSTESTLRDKRRRRRQKVVNCCKQLVAFLFSHIGLAGMVVAYSILGGFLFRALEAPHELRVKVAVGRFKREKIDAISRLHETHAVGENFTRGVQAIFGEFQRKVVEEVKINGWDGKDYDDDDKEAKLQWSFAGALLYAVTVVTTIGYGHIAPKTNWGRMVTIIYALIGIPLTFLYLSNIGNFLADCFRLFYKRICCDVCCCQKCERQQKRQKLKLRHQRREIYAAAASQRTVRLTSRAPINSNISGFTGSTVTVRRRAISAHTMPKTRVDGAVVAGKPAMTSCKNQNELKPEVAGNVRSPKASVGSGAESTISGASSLFASATASTALTSPSTTGGYENLKETDILNNVPLSSPRVKLPGVVCTSDIDCVADPKRPRLEQVVLDVNELERRQQRMLIDFINSKETDLVDDIRTITTKRSPDATQLLGNDQFLGNDTTGDRQQLPEPAAVIVADARNSPSVAGNVVGITSKSEADQNAAMFATKRNPKFTSKVRSKSVACCNAPNVYIAKQEHHCDVRNVTAERRRYFRRKMNNSNDATKTNASATTVCGEVRELPPPPLEPASAKNPSIESQNLKGTVGLSKNCCRARGGHLNRSQSSVKRKVDDNNSVPTVSNVTVKVKRSATFGGPDVISTDAGGSGALLRRFRQRLTPNLSARRALRRNSLDGSCVSLSGRAVGDDVDAAAGSTESFVTACGDSEFRLNVDADESPGYDVSAGTTGRGELIVVGGCRTNSDNNVSAVDDSDRTNWPPTSGDAHVGRSASACIKDPRLAVDLDSTVGRRDLLSFPVVDDDEDADADDPFDIDEDVLAMRGHRGSSSDGGAEAKVSVPISICLIIIAVYIIAGSALFAIWEDWDYLTGSYFCFITLSTIGFGDVVPGTDMDQWASHEKLVLCALWLAFGLSLLAMCFNLMQEEVKEKCKWLGRKLGLLKDEGAR